jgi:hypothetical protein
VTCCPPGVTQGNLAPARSLGVLQPCVPFCPSGKPLSHAKWPAEESGDSRGPSHTKDVPNPLSVFCLAWYLPHPERQSTYKKKKPNKTLIDK